ncbi:porin [Caballeronia choica]|uniref:Porin n=1 Tax=Caballeronia choica TaxID=326476 RepID=A0A158J3Y9_9BURK|nr:porin [Caballeronia choica]
MLKKCLSLSVGVACMSSAHAQSSVTLYGLIDLGVTYLNSAQTGRVGSQLNGKSQVAMSDGHATGLSGSRWGLRGTEDLGGGMQALFVLENGFMANTGTLAQGGAEFGRQAYVGISSSGLATLTVGRQYDPLVDSVQQFAASGNWGGYMSSHVGDVDNLSNTSRINNSIKIATSPFKAVKAEALYSLGGVAGNATQNQVWSLGVSYAGTSFNFGAGYLNARNPNVSFYGNTPNKGLATANNIGSPGSPTTPEVLPAYAGYASANTLQIIGLGGSYSIGPTIVSAVATNTRFQSMGSASGPNPLAYSGNATFNSVELGVRSYITPSLLTGVAFDYTQRSSVKGDGGAKYLQLDTGVDYFLSKRTDAYVLAVLQRATGRDSLGQAAVANISGFTASSTDKQIGLRVGLRHRF